MVMIDELRTLPMLAVEVGVREDQVRRAVRQGRLSQPRKAGRFLVFSLAQVEEARRLFHGDERGEGRR